MTIRHITNASWNRGLSFRTVSADKKKNSDSPSLALSLAGSECRWHCSRAPMGSTVGVGGVDEPARSTDVFYGLALLLGSRGPLILTREETAECDSPSPRAIQL